MALALPRENFILDKARMKLASSPSGGKKKAVATATHKGAEPPQFLVHPCTNEATVALEFDDLLKFISALEHKYVIV